MRYAKSRRVVAWVGTALIALAVTTTVRGEASDPMKRLRKVSLKTDDKVRLSALYLPTADVEAKHGRRS